MYICTISENRRCSLQELKRVLWGRTFLFTLIAVLIVNAVLFYNEQADNDYGLDLSVANEIVWGMDGQITIGNDVNAEECYEKYLTYIEQYQVYKRLEAKVVVAVPFGPNPLGFLVIRNPQRYQQRTSTLNTLAYVLHRAMAQRDTMDRAKMALSPEEIKTDKDIVINFFGNLEIYTKDGVWKEQDFHSPKCTRAVAYIMLHDKTAHSALAIADALYPEDTSDVDTINKNVRGYIYRFRKSFDLISEYQLIEYTSNGYRLNPALNIKTDIQQFSALWKQLQEEMPLPQRVHTLKSAIKLYRGAVFASACDDHWLVGIATKYKMKYISIVNELLSILADFKDYDGIHHFALKGLSRVPENVKAYYSICGRRASNHLPQTRIRFFRL